MAAFIFKKSTIYFPNNEMNMGGERVLKVVKYKKHKYFMSSAA